MRICFISFLLLVVSTGLFSQYDIVWESYFDIDRPRIPLDIITTSAGNHLVSGYKISNLPGGLTDGYLMMLSSQGEVIWENEYSYGIDGFLSGIIEVADGFVLGGYTENNPWNLKVNFDGEQIWEDVIEGEKTEYIFDVIGTEDGGFALVGASDEGGFLEFKVSLYKFSSTGELEWVQYFGEENTQYGFSVVQDDNGHFIIGANKFDQLTFDREFVLIKVTSSGEQLWRKEYQGIEGDNFLNSLKLVSDGYLFAGVGDQDARIIKTNFNGDLIWERYIGGAGVETLADLSITDDENIICVGSTTSDEVGVDTGVKKIMLLALDTDGNTLWRDASFDSKYLSGTDLSSIKDGSFVIAGEYAESGNFSDDIFVMKLQTGSSPTSDLNPQPTLQLYPNPTADKLVVTVTPSSLGSSYTIYNSLGQLCGTGQIDKVSFLIDVANLESGEYLFKTEGASQRAVMQFVKL